jgi:NADPH2:quinone reductase
VTGAYAEKVVCEEGQVHRLADGVSFSQGAALGVPYVTAWRGLSQRGGAKKGDIVLVHGASGGVGIASVQLAKAEGMVVIGTAGTQEGRELIQREGAEYALDNGEAGYMEKVMELTDGRGVDVVLEMLANVNLGCDLEIMAMGGRVVVIGCRGTVEINPRLAMKKDLSIVGMITTNASAEELAEIHRGIGKGLEDGSIGPVVGLELPLAEAARAHREVMESRHLGKIVLVCK